MNSVVKIISDKELLTNGFVPLSLIIGTVLIIIIITCILVKKEIKGVKKNEKN